MSVQWILLINQTLPVVTKALQYIYNTCVV
jgi:hypothetical protein